MKQINCEVIQDLLPSYSDKISSDTTNKLVEEHLQDCKECQEVLKDMNKRVDTQPLNSQTEKINYLKGFKKRRKLLIALSIILTIMILVSIFIINLFNNNIMLDSFLYVDVYKMNVEYMYVKENKGINETTGEVYTYKTLEIYLYSDEYDEKKDIYLTGGCSIKDEDKEITYHIGANKLPKNMEFDGSGLEISIPLNENVERIYLQDTKNISKEIWNKDMIVKNEEEWRKWYIDNYVPKEIKEQYNMTYENIPIYTSIWKHLYNKNLKK